MSKEIVFASNNPNKLEEVRKILEEKYRVLSLKDIGCTDELPETQDTLEGNALQKARYVADKFNVVCFADDTGLEVEALDGRPGVYSARYAGPNCSAEDNMVKLLGEMENRENRKARFRTVVAYISGDAENTFVGEVAGTIADKKHGNQGFGYDPIFIPEGNSKSFAEMDGDAKNAISHRGRAIRKFAEFLLNQD